MKSVLPILPKNLAGVYINTFQDEQVLARLNFKRVLAMTYLYISQT